MRDDPGVFGERDTERYERGRAYEYDPTDDYLDALAERPLTPAQRARQRIIEADAALIAARMGGA